MVAREVGERPRGGDAVLQREAGARRRLRAVAEHPPAAVRPAAELEGEEVQEVPAGGVSADHRPQIFGARGDQAAAAAGPRRPAGWRRRCRRRRARAARRAGPGRRRSRCHSLSSISSGTCASGHSRSLDAGLVVGAVVDAGIAQILVGAGEAGVDFAAAESARGASIKRLPGRPDPAVRRRPSRRRAWPRTVVRRQHGRAAAGCRGLRLRAFHGAQSPGRAPADRASAGSLRCAPPSAAR